MTDRPHPRPDTIVRRDPVEAGRRLAERFRPSLEIMAHGTVSESMADPETREDDLDDLGEGPNNPKG